MDFLLTNFQHSRNHVQPNLLGREKLSDFPIHTTKRRKERLTEKTFPYYPKNAVYFWFSKRINFQCNLWVGMHNVRSISKSFHFGTGNLKNECEFSDLILNFYDPGLRLVFSQSFQTSCLLRSGNTSASNIFWIVLRMAVQGIFGCSSLSGLVILIFVSLFKYWIPLSQKNKNNCKRNKRVKVEKIYLEQKWHVYISKIRSIADFSKWWTLHSATRTLFLVWWTCRSAAWKQNFVWSSSMCRSFDSMVKFSSFELFTKNGPLYDQFNCVNNFKYMKHGLL